MAEPAAEGTRRPASKGEAREQRKRILGSRRFERSANLSAFLRFAVEGRGGQLEERRIAERALRRGENSDPRIDPMIHIQAGRPRRALGG